MASVDGSYFGGTVDSFAASRSCGGRAGVLIPGTIDEFASARNSGGRSGTLIELCGGEPGPAAPPIPPTPEPIPVLPVITDPILATDGLRLAVMISLFSDRRVEDGTVVPANDGDLRGWWADEFAIVPGDKIGSRLWLLDRSTGADNVAIEAQQYAEEALAWLIEDRVASRVDVVAEFEDSTLTLEITIERPSGDPASFRFSAAWDAEAAALKLPPVIM